MLAILGLVTGSFVGASVWRLRFKQLIEDKAEGEPVDDAEFERLSVLHSTKTTEDRSRCLHCGHVLHWYDLVPLVSWLTLSGKCRYCRTKIGWYEPLVEVGTASVFVVSYVAWPGGFSNPIDGVQFGLWLASVSILIGLFIYDLKWFLLPNYLMYPFIVLSGLFAALGLYEAGWTVDSFVSLAGAVALLSGLYLVLHKLSKGEWIGFGDVKLGLGLAFLLGDWVLGFIALFLANVLGLVAVIPGMIKGDVHRQTRIPFGPFMIAGMLIAFFAGYVAFDWYQSLFVNLF